MIKQVALVLIIVMSIVSFGSPVSAATSGEVELDDGSSWRYITENYLAGFEPEGDPSIEINRLYKGILGRAPEPEGLAYWTNEMNKGLTLNKIAEYFISSPEYKLTTGEPETFVTALYNNVLKRDPDAQGFKYWMDIWSADANSFEAAGRIATYFTNSEEHHNQLAKEYYRYTTVRYISGGVPPTTTPVGDSEIYIPLNDSHEETHKLIESVFGKYGPSIVQDAVIISHCENSQHDPDLVYTNVGGSAPGTRDIGIFQINSYFHENQIIAALPTLSEYSQQVWNSTGGNMEVALYNAVFNVEIAEYIALDETWRGNQTQWMSPHSAGGSGNGFRGGKWGSWTCGYLVDKWWY